MLAGRHRKALPGGKVCTDEKRHWIKCLFSACLFSIATASTIPANAAAAGAEAVISGTANPALAQSAPPSASCLDDELTQAVRIARITDGDTVVLEDERRVRLIGLNALELNSLDERDRQLAHRARTALAEFLDGQSVAIIPGLEPHDRHGRTLAHVRLADGRDAAQAMVSQGLALAVTVGRNARCADLLHSLERQARLARRGVWRTPGSWWLDEPMSGRERGFHVITGRVRTFGGHGNRTTLTLDNGLSIKLGKSWPKEAGQASGSLKELVGRLVRVRGWLRSTPGKPALTLHHPGNLEIIDQ